MVNPMDHSRHATVRFEVLWTSADATHNDHYYLADLNLWRDYLPGDMGEALATIAPGTTIERSYVAGTLVEPYSPSHIYDAKTSQFRSNFRGSFNLQPKVGRFFPRALIPGVGDTFEGDMRPFRVLSCDETRMQVDLNHALARYPLTVRATLQDLLPSSAEHGGRCNDVPELITGRGPGLQAALPGLEPVFFDGDWSSRMDERDDREFYEQPRLVQHLDSTARSEIAMLYARMLQPEMRVLDLMASWDSHLATVDGLKISGLGLNAEELHKNAALCERVIQDLNVTPALDFPDRHFDAVVCTASVEYLTQPFAIFAEVARVLKPGKPFIVTFSDRWFPTKSIRVWDELHPFERMGLVLTYFRRAGLYEDLHTLSVRNLPRPTDDKYYGQIRNADPVFAVWGKKRAA